MSVGRGFRLYDDSGVVLFYQLIGQSSRGIGQVELGL